MIEPSIATPPIEAAALPGVADGASGAGRDVAALRDRDKVVVVVEVDVVDAMGVAAERETSIGVVVLVGMTTACGARGEGAVVGGTI